MSIDSIYVSSQKLFVSARAILAMLARLGFAWLIATPSFSGFTVSDPVNNPV